MGVAPLVKMCVNCQRLVDNATKICSQCKGNKFVSVNLKSPVEGYEC